uniref:DNA-directed RNA polymerase n=1 Tax=Panagrolaimus sp. JU765 TaxID=591449 RepID=A0AC34QFK3_9BILA
MREAILRGPEDYSGACFVSITGKDTGKRRLADDRQMSQQDARLLQTAGGKYNNDVTVYRQLLKNEMLLMNRQPSLHKPIIMGHRARILEGRKALRMNYEPCKAYNADFDGAEMNIIVFYIQNVLGQVEARELADVGSSYLVPKDGTPILGLIQDHMVSDVLLTLRDTSLNKKDFTHLILAAFGNYTKRIILPPPTILLLLLLNFFS